MSTKLQVDELDFAKIKQNLIEFLRAQTDLLDYDYEGSAMSTFLDVLAYNTYYNTLYTNFAINESFIDSASKYSSIVSIAKTLGYRPKSYTAAKATIEMVIDAPNTERTSLTLPIGSTFKGRNGYGEFNFVLLDEYTAPKVNDQFLFNQANFSRLTIYQGTLLSSAYDVVNEETKFVIPNKRIDTNTIKVRVYANPSASTFEVFTHAEDYLTVKATDPVYFIKIREDGFYELYFGQGIIGRAIANGNRVVVEYITCEGAVANNADRFEFSTSVSGDASLTFNITTIDRAFGGFDQENKESIRFNAPKMFRAQGRAVNEEDYEVLLKQNFSFVDQLKVWGGQNNTPPIYGKVFICVKPASKSILSETERNQIKDFLKLKAGMLTITHELVDPEYTDVIISAQAYYDKNKTIRTSETIASMVKDAVKEYFGGLSTFNLEIRNSKLSKLVDSAEASIQYNNTVLSYRRNLNPIYNFSSQYIVNLNAALKGFPNTTYSLISNDLSVSGYPVLTKIYDDGSGNLVLYRKNTDLTYSPDKTIGTVNYDTGLVKIDELNIIRGKLELYFNTTSGEYKSIDRDILRILDKDIRITVTQIQ